MSGSYPSAKGYREREMSEIASPKLSVIERLAVANCRALWEAAVERPGEDNVDELSARTISRELATILREMPEELVRAVKKADIPPGVQAAAIQVIADWLDNE